MKETVQIPDGVPKSGRVWKVKQTARSSAQLKKGILSHLSKTYEEREIERQKRRNVKELEQEMIEDKKQKKLEEKLRREAQEKRRQENEYKNSITQELKPEKLKGMSKKQLRSVRKTAVNKFGQVELVNPWGGESSKDKNSKMKKSGRK